MQDQTTLNTGDPNGQSPENPAVNGNPADNGSQQTQDGQSADGHVNGLSDAEKAQLEQYEQNALHAQRKITQQGQEKAELQTRVEQLETQLANQQQPAPNVRVPDDLYEGIDLDRLRQESPDVFDVLERQHNFMEQTAQGLVKRDNDRIAQEQDAAQFSQYQDKYGISREQYDAVKAHRSQGNYFAADEMLSLYQKQNSARQAQVSQQQQDRQRVIPSGDSNTSTAPDIAPKHQTPVEAEIERLKGLSGAAYQSATSTIYDRFSVDEATRILRAIV